MKTKKEPKTKQEIVAKFSPYELEDSDLLERFFDKLDKIWQAEFGKECPEFCPNCAQCKFSLIYNNFKQKVYDEVFKK